MITEPAAAPLLLSRCTSGHVASSTTVPGASDRHGVTLARRPASLSPAKRRHSLSGCVAAGSETGGRRSGRGTAAEPCLPGPVRHRSVASAGPTASGGSRLSPAAFKFNLKATSRLGPQ